MTLIPGLVLPVAAFAATSLLGWAVSRQGGKEHERRAEFFRAQRDAADTVIDRTLAVGGLRRQLAVIWSREEVPFRGAPHLVAMLVAGQSYTLTTGLLIMDDNPARLPGMLVSGPMAILTAGLTTHLLLQLRYTLRARQLVRRRYLQGVLRPGVTWSPSISSLTLWTWRGRWLVSLLVAATHLLGMGVGMALGLRDQFTRTDILVASTAILSGALAGSCLLYLVLTWATAETPAHDAQIDSLSARHGDSVRVTPELSYQI